MHGTINHFKVSTNRQKYLVLFFRNEFKCHVPLHCTCNVTLFFFFFCLFWFVLLLPIQNISTSGMKHFSKKGVIHKMSTFSSSLSSKFFSFGLFGLLIPCSFHIRRKTKKKKLLVSLSFSFLPSSWTK